MKRPSRRGAASVGIYYSDPRMRLDGVPGIDGVERKVE